MSRVEPLLKRAFHPHFFGLETPSLTSYRNIILRGESQGQKERQPQANLRLALRRREALKHGARPAA